MLSSADAGGGQHETWTLAARPRPNRRSFESEAEPFAEIQPKTFNVDLNSHIHEKFQVPKME